MRSFPNGAAKSHSPVKGLALQKYGTIDPKVCTEGVKYIHLP